MYEAAASGQLTMRWAPVVDEAGRTRMEARWVVVGEEPASAPSTQRPAHVGHAA